jgi:hypothetical protein
MPAPDPTEARFPHARAKAGMYESFYLKLCHPTEPLGAWIRYTVHKRPGNPLTGSLWFTLFERGGPRAVKTTTPAPAPGGGQWIRVGESALGEGRAVGEASAGEREAAAGGRDAVGARAREAAWELRFDSAERPLFHLPRDWMYSGPLPRTKLLSPAPSARFDGRLTVDGREVEVAGWRGMVGHNWGAQHAERWIWLHGLGFEGAGEATWLDLAIGRIKLGPVITPWIANGGLSVDGERIRLGGPGRRVGVEERPDRCDFTLPGKGVKVRGTVSAPREDFVGWVYADPDGGEHHTVNCSIADMRLEVEREGRPPLELSLASAAAYELGMRERDHGMEIQPFPDG